MNSRVPHPATASAASTPGSGPSSRSVRNSIRTVAQQIYGHAVYFAETFIDPARFRGTCYRAANWKLLGITTGRGKDSTSKRPNRSLKEVLGYPLAPNFRGLLSQL